jgi:hypothetical protein
MGVAGVAKGLYPYHTESGVLFVFDRIFFDRLRKTGPSGTRFELDGRIEQGGIAADTVVFSGLVRFAVSSRMGRFRPFFTGNLKLFGGQAFPPFRFGLFDPSVGFGVSLFTKSDNILPRKHNGPFDLDEMEMSSLSGLDLFYRFQLRKFEYVHLTFQDMNKCFWHWSF